MLWHASCIETFNNIIHVFTAVVVTECGLWQGLDVGLAVSWPESSGKEGAGNGLPQYFLSKVGEGGRGDHPREAFHAAE